MPALSQSDAEWLLRFVADAGEIGGDEPFTREFLAELGRRLADGAVDELHRTDGNASRGGVLVTSAGDVDPTGADVLRERPREASLTGREREIVGWVARGKTNRQIAELLCIAPSTVRKHLENVYVKLGVSTRTAAAARFLGAIDAGSP